jgi:hypothetical protein
MIKGQAKMNVVAMAISISTPSVVKERTSELMAGIIMQCKDWQPGNVQRK